MFSRTAVKAAVPNEETADFRKPAQITTIDYVKSRKDFNKADAAHKPQLFLNYCFAVINQKNEGALTIREAAYAISDCEAPDLSDALKRVIAEATSLRRHPSNYKEDHQVGWTNFVKHISELRKRI